MNLRQVRKRRGLATIVTAIMMICATIGLGGAGMVWSQSIIYSQPEALANIAAVKKFKIK
jgi:hypothetical protein